MDLNDFLDPNENSNNGVDVDELESKIEIRVKQRNGRKRIMTVYGLEADKDLLTVIKKELCKIMQCGVAVKKDKENEKLFLQIQSGDTAVVIKYLTDNNYVNSEDITTRGL